MKKQYRILFVLLLAAGSLCAQDVSHAGASRMLVTETDSSAKLKLFSATYNSGSVYLKWIVANQHRDGMYVILRSSDNTTFEPIGFKEGVGVPVSLDISYYFEDDSPGSGTVFYRLLYLDKSPGEALSQGMVLLNIPTLLCEAKNKP